jgi:adenine phosphoribosyltransferase
MPQAFAALVRAVPDFPKPGILFRDITPVLQDPVAFGRLVALLADRYSGGGVTHVVGIESRGFIIGAPLALRLGVGFVVARKPGKLPRARVRASYKLEYGEDALEMHDDALGSGSRVLVVDDLIATGGTAAAAIQLVRGLGGAVLEVAVVIELIALAGRTRMDGVPVHSLLQY